MLVAKVSTGKMLWRKYQTWPKRIKIYKALSLVPGTQSECLLNKYTKPPLNGVYYLIVTWCGIGGHYLDMLVRPNIFTLQQL